MRMVESRQTTHNFLKPKYQRYSTEKYETGNETCFLLKKQYQKRHIILYKIFQICSLTINNNIISFPKTTPNKNTKMFFLIN